MALQIAADNNAVKDIEQRTVRVVPSCLQSWVMAPTRPASLASLAGCSRALGFWLFSSTQRIEFRGHALSFPDPTLVGDRGTTLRSVGYILLTVSIISANATSSPDSVSLRGERIKSFRAIFGTALAMLFKTSPFSTQKLGIRRDEYRRDRSLKGGD
jgi:hypothetical protein